MTMQSETWRVRGSRDPQEEVPTKHHQLLSIPQAGRSRDTISSGVSRPLVNDVVDVDWRLDHLMRWIWLFSVATETATTHEERAL